MTAPEYAQFQNQMSGAGKSGQNACPPSSWKQRNFEKQTRSAIDQIACARTFSFNGMTNVAIVSAKKA